MTLFQNKRVLVTGGSGFIASHLCRRLVKEGANVAITTKYNSLIDNVRLADLWSHLVPIEADLRNSDSLVKIRSFKPHIIYHFAAYNHVGDSFENVTEAIDVNGRGSVNLLEAVSDYERFIYISSSEVYGYQTRFPFHEESTPFPISPYAVGKYCGELYARMMWHVHQRPIVVLRPFNAFGPYQSPRAIIGELILKCLRGEEIITTEGKQTRDFNYIENLVDGFLFAVTREEAIGKIVNVGSGIEISIADLVKKVHQFTASSSKLSIGKHPYRPTEIWRMAADSTKAREILGWTPQTSFDEGLRRTIEWYRKYIDIFDHPSSSLLELSRFEIDPSS